MKSTSYTYDEIFHLAVTFIEAHVSCENGQALDRDTVNTMAKAMVEFNIWLSEVNDVEIDASGPCN